MAKTYLGIINESPLLEKYRDEKNFKYIPIFHLAFKVQEKASTLMKNNLKDFEDNGFDKNSKSHFPLNENDAVDVDCKKRTIFIIEYLLNINYPHKDDNNGAIFNFWSSAKLGGNSISEKKTSHQLPPLHFINLISRAIGYKSFEKFINQYFRTSETIKIIIFPFLKQLIHPIDIEDIISYELNLLQKKESLSLDIVKLESKNTKLPINFNWDDIINIGEKFHGDLLIWGRINHDKLIHISYYSLKQEISFFWNSNPLNHYECKDIAYNSFEKFKESLLWSTAFRHALKKEYRKSINIFRKLLNANIYTMEVHICLAVIYHLKKYNVYVYHHIIATIAIAIEKSHKETKILMSEIYSFDNKDTSIINHLIKDWENLNVNKNPDKATQIWKYSGIIFFEFVASMILLKYKELFKPKTFEDLLNKTFKNIEKSWLDSDYAEVFAKVYFEMGQLKEEKLLTNLEIGPEDVYELYKIAIFHSSNKYIHSTCKKFFQKYGQFEKIKKAVKKSGIKSSEIKALYQ